MAIFQKEKPFIVRKWAMNFLTTTLPLCAYLFTFNVFVTAIIYVQNGFSVGSYSLKCSYFSWNKSLKLWKENILTYLTFFDNSPEPYAKRNCVTKNFETQIIPRRQMPFWKRNSGGALSFRNYNLKQNMSIIKILSFIDSSARATLQT